MRLINPLVILRIFSTILFIESISFLLCLPVAHVYNESPYPFLWSSLISIIISVSFFFVSRNTPIHKITNREGFLVVSLSWILFSLLGALPFIFSGTVTSFVDAFFETASGFTTTGATIFEDVEILPHTILFWRNLTQWIGGLGIIFLVIVILPTFRITAHQLFSLESSLKEKILPRTKAIGFRLLYIYLALTISEVILLSLGEMNLFDSICHTFSTVSTGGYSTKNSSLSDYSAYSQYIVALFMFLSGISFVIYFYLVNFKFKKVFYNEELWFYILVVVTSVISAILILIIRANEPFEPALRNGIFQVISIITTTGFITNDYLNWPHAGKLLIFILLFTGACTGSTTGGIKMLRHLIVLKNIRAVFRKLIHPSAISQIKLNGITISDRTNIAIISFVVLYLFIFVIGTIIITINGTDPVSSASAVIATLGNTGPGLGTIGPVFNYAHMPDFSKIVFSLLMIIGRLEINTLFILFTRSFWRI
ncbi:MAG: TrkH family potassium uptake protein [Bacteroidales bacterium]|nr:TrkH family potassium uptake protein [Bacteroidales bacterium]